MKINLYKKSIIEYIKNDNIKQDIFYMIGILFLTEMNRNCKNNNISYHGYYIASSFIYFYKNIIENIINKKNDIKNNIVISICKNINYLNQLNFNVKNKINNNLYLFIIEINKYLDVINENNKFEYINIIDNLFKPFFYILFLTSSFMASGIYNEPNLLKVSEYYSNIFYVYHFINSEVDNKQFLYELYKKNLINLNTAILELNISNDTVFEILSYIDDEIIKKL